MMGLRFSRAASNPNALKKKPERHPRGTAAPRSGVAFELNKFMALMIAEALVPIFFVIFLGYFAGARRIIDYQNLASLNVLLVTYAAPTALFVGVAQISRSGLKENGKLVLVLVISMLVIFGITFALNHCVFRLSPTPTSSSVSVPARKCCVLLGTSRRRVREGLSLPPISPSNSFALVHVPNQERSAVSSPSIHCCPAG